MGLPYGREPSGSDDGFGSVPANEFPGWVKATLVMLWRPGVDEIWDVNWLKDFNRGVSAVFRAWKEGTMYHV